MEPNKFYECNMENIILCCIQLVYFTTIITISLCCQTICNITWTRYAKNTVVDKVAYWGTVTKWPTQNTKTVRSTRNTQKHDSTIRGQQTITEQKYFSIKLHLDAVSTVVLAPSLSLSHYFIIHQVSSQMSEQWRPSRVLSGICFV